MKKEREEAGLNNLVNIGSWNLHVVHGTLKSVLESLEGCSIFFYRNHSCRNLIDWTEIIVLSKIRKTYSFVMYCCVPVSVDSSGIISKKKWKPGFSYQGRVFLDSYSSRYDIKVRFSGKWVCFLSHWNENF